MIEEKKALNKEIMDMLTEEQKIVFLKTLLYISKIDGEVAQGEAKFIKKMANKYKIENLSKIFEPTSEQKILSELKILRQRRVAMELIKEMFRLGHTDYELGDEEILFIGRVAAVTGIEIKKVEQISTWIIDYVIWKEQEKIIFEED
ncbi:MAG: hypothetical protein IKS23_04215 [Alphaproteobacteria bacterium]|nr:hypothetical protein [Alphaproteobacteria bacterium]